MTDDYGPFHPRVTVDDELQRKLERRPRPKPADDDATRIGHTLGLVLAGLVAAAVTIAGLMLVAKLLVMLWVGLFQ